MSFQHASQMFAVHSHFCRAALVLMGVVVNSVTAVSFLVQGHRSYPNDVRLRLNNYKNIQYIGTFTVGGQELPVIYDTGSFEIIVLSDLCKDC